MNLYQELAARQQKEFDAFPIYFAFGEEQIDELIKSLGLSKIKGRKNYYAKRLVGIGAGGVVLREDATKFVALCKRHRQEFADMVAADPTGDGFIFDMFEFELRNHEYGYVYSDAIEDTLRALGYTMDQVEADPRLLHGFNKACQVIARSEEP